MTLRDGFGFLFSFPASFFFLMERNEWGICSSGHLNTIFLSLSMNDNTSLVCCIHMTIKCLTMQNQKKNEIMTSISIHKWHQVSTLWSRMFNITYCIAISVVEAKFWLGTRLITYYELEFWLGDCLTTHSLQVVQRKALL